jgi:methionyl-tRNA formyltransferase
MRVVFMGVPKFAVPALSRLAYSEHEVAAVYTRPDKPSGRGRGISESPVKRAAVELGLDVRQVESFKSSDDVAALAKLKPDVIVVASFGVILPQSVLDMPPYDCLNLHPSLLPRYRGPTPIPAAILAGDDVTGTSIMLIEKKIDSGPILSQQKILVEPADTTQSLTERLALVSADLLMETLPGWLSRSIAPRPQRHEDATYTKMLNKSDGELYWRLSAVELWRRVRAYYPWPVAFTSWNGRVIRILESSPQGGRIDMPGRVLDLGDGEVGVQTGDGILKLVMIQIEGKKEMGVEEFVRGQRGFVGSMLPS